MISLSCQGHGVPGWMWGTATEMRIAFDALRRIVAFMQKAFDAVAKWGEDAPGEVLKNRALESRFMATARNLKERVPRTL